MSSTYGDNIRLTVFGQSHSPAIGVTIEGLPAGETLDLEALRRFEATLTDANYSGGGTHAKAG